MSVEPETPNPLDDLAERLAQRADELAASASRSTSFTENARLSGKAQGLRLALSFVNEMVRDRRPTVQAVLDLDDHSVEPLPPMTDAEWVPYAESIGIECTCDEEPVCPVHGAPERREVLGEEPQ